MPEITIKIECEPHCRYSMHIQPKGEDDKTFKVKFRHNKSVLNLPSGDYVYLLRAISNRGDKISHHIDGTKDFPKKPITKEFKKNKLRLLNSFSI